MSTPEQIATWLSQRYYKSFEIAREAETFFYSFFGLLSSGAAAAAFSIKELPAWITVGYLCTTLLLLVIKYINKCDATKKFIFEEKTAATAMNLLAKGNVGEIPNLYMRTPENSKNTYFIILTFLFPIFVALFSGISTFAIMYFLKIECPSTIWLTSIIVGLFASLGVLINEHKLQNERFSFKK